MSTVTRKSPEKNNFSFYSGNLKLDGTLFYPAHKKAKNPAILFIHGRTSERERSFQYAEALAKLGYNSYICLLFDMRGHGTSEGDINSFTHKEFLDDVLTAYDYLSNIESVDKKNISAIGSSFGGYLAALLSAKRKIKNLVLRAPADYPNESFNKLKTHSDQEIMAWRNKTKNPKESYALEALHKFKGNVLIIESEKDDSVPHQTIMNYVNAVKNRNKLTHVVMKGAPHSIKEGKFRDEVERILTEWFKKLL